MDCKITMILKDADFQKPQFIKRIIPESDSDSGFRVYLGLEYRHNPQMLILGDVETYLRDMGLYDLVHDLPVNHKIDMMSSIPAYPQIEYKNNILKFSPSGLLPLIESQYYIEGMVFDEEKDSYIIPYKNMTLEDKLLIRWKDRRLISKISGT